MKNSLLIFALMILILTSCKKDRTCTCSITRKNYLGSSVKPNQITTYKKIKKSEAKKMCQNKTVTDSLTTMYSGSGGYGDYTSDTYDCKLK